MNIFGAKYSGKCVHWNEHKSVSFFSIFFFKLISNFLLMLWTLIFVPIYLVIDEYYLFRDMLISIFQIISGNPHCKWYSHKWVRFGLVPKYLNSLKSMHRLTCPKDFSPNSPEIRCVYLIILLQQFVQFLDENM